MVQTVVSASVGALGPLLVKLAGLLAGEYGRLKGVRREIRCLQSELTSMHAALKEYTELEDPIVDPRLHAFFAEETHLVGVDGPRDDLSQWMLEGNNSSKHCKVLSIVGFGGLGKTTLAKEVYRKIQGHFHCWAFVSVSQKPDIKKIIKDVISQVSCKDLSTNDTSDWDEKKYIAKLRELLNDKRYLIVIDDVWSTQAWNAIKCAFPENNCTSRIIATTRIIDVGKSCCQSLEDRMYAMEALSDLHSRRLFFKRIFSSDDHCPDMLNEVSSEILKKCGGLPLAIISISSLLANRPAVKEEWEKVTRSIGYALENRQSLEGLNSILSLSYNDLPPNLKACLLYLSIFPEDYFIDRERLVRRWIAEGFISVERGQCQQEIAENYFYELINKSMIQAVDIGYDGKVPYCRVHDMMLEIIISKSSEDNFTIMVGGGQTNLTNHHRLIRRLSIQHIDQELSSALANEDLSHVRSLTITSSGCLKHFPCLGKFQALRVLDFQGCKGLEEYNMSNIDKLFQLKYVSLRNTKISELPPRIVMLHDLETLDIRETNIQDLPAGIVLLTKLQYLLTDKRVKIPHGICNMRSLQVFSSFDINKSSLDAVEELGNLTRLRELCFWLDGGDQYKMHGEILLSSLCKLGSCKLKTLYIYGWRLTFWDGGSMSNYIYLPQVSKWISPGLTSLAHLKFSLAELIEEGLRSLGEVPSLLILDMTFHTGPKEKLTIIGFPCLREFKLFSTDGAYVTFTKGVMPKLEILELPFDVSVAKPYGFCLDIEHLPCLKEIGVSLSKKGATLSESKAAAAAIKNEVGVHPNHPKVTISRK
ncbi:hypothetical protein ACQ4PT_002620 [Festuca glaucescens]